MTDTKKKILIGVIAGLVIAAIVIVIVILTSGKDADEGNTDPANNEGVTSAVTPPVTDIEPTDIEPADTVTPQITKEPDNPVITEPVSEEHAKAVLGTYKGIKAVYAPKEITDEDVNKELENLQKLNSYYIDLPDRAFESGDMAIVTINVFIDGQYYEDLSVNYYQVVLGDGNIPDFMENEIIGSKKEQFVNAYYSYPDDFENKEIAGKTVQYNMELVDGFELYVPEITDTFIRENTEYNTVAAYRSGMKVKMQDEENTRAHEETLNSIKNTLIENCSYSGDIDNEIKKAYVLKTQKNDAEAKEYGYPDGVTRYVYEYGMTSEEYQNKIKAEAEFDVKYQLALDEIIEIEKIAASNSGLSKTELRNIAEQFVIDSADVDGENY